MNRITHSLFWAMLLLAVAGAPASHGGVVFSTIYSFATPVSSAQGGVVQGSDGNFYGTTACGGSADLGTVFSMSANGTTTILYSFTGGSDGSRPYGGLAQGSDGNFYGTTARGGVTTGGTVFKIAASGALTTLYSFTGGKDGGQPWAALVQGSDGSFYGTTKSGGANGGGTVFKMTANGALTTLYSFASSPYSATAGNSPVSALVQGSDGNLYGTTQYGGSSGGGTIFEITTNGTLTTLYFGAGGSALAQGTNGDFYGTALRGGTYNSGSVFEINPVSATFTSLYSFSGSGFQPEAGLALGSDGNFYGTTSSGGAKGYGTVFRLTPSGAVSRLYSFTNASDGGSPCAPLVQGSDGNFYGTTPAGLVNSVSHLGTVFKITPAGALTTLYSFTSALGGANPGSALVSGSDGSLYGTTTQGGADNYGTVFRISPSGALSNLYSFTNGIDGYNPAAPLAQGSDGNFYGTTQSGGTSGFGYGTVFSISPSGTLNSMYSFTGLSDGQSPVTALVQGSDGSFYGATSGGSLAGYSGTVFKITPGGALTTLHTLANDGANTLVQGTDGNFYGTTVNSCGEFFRMATNGALTVLHSFSAGSDGCQPSAVVQGSDGSFYGTTQSGGESGGNGNGTIFKITTSGVLSNLHVFPNNVSGSATALIRGGDGNFYGTTTQTILMISAAGVLTNLYSFTNGYDGGSPSALVQGSDGNFYGTTTGDGADRSGTVFRLSVTPPLAPVFTGVSQTGNVVSFAWSAIIGATYQVQVSPSLSSSSWASLGSSMVAGATNLSATDSVANAQRFYRVILLP